MGCFCSSHAHHSHLEGLCETRDILRVVPTVANMTKPLRGSAPCHLRASVSCLQSRTDRNSWQVGKAPGFLSFSLIWIAYIFLGDKGSETPWLSSPCRPVPPGSVRALVLRECLRGGKGRPYGSLLRSPRLSPMPSAPCPFPHAHLERHHLGAGGALAKVLHCPRQGLLGQEVGFQAEGWGAWGLCVGWG